MSHRTLCLSEPDHPRSLSHFVPGGASFRIQPNPSPLLNPCASMPLSLRIAIPRVAGAKHRRHTTPDGDILIGKTLGSGSQGQVHAALHAVSRRRLALKILPKHSRQARQEACVLSHLPPHAHVVRAPLGCSIQHSSDRTFIPLQLAQTDLLETLLSRGSLPQARARDLFIQVCDALAHCHAHGVFHLDIKPENVLMRSGRALLADFGSSLTTTDTTPVADFPSGSVGNTAPEVATGSPYNAAAADVWSLGVLLFTMVTCRRPFTRATPSNVLFTQLCNGTYPWPASMSPSLIELLSGMLTVDPKARWGLDAVRSATWLQAPLPTCLEVVAPDTRPVVSLSACTTRSTLSSFPSSGSLPSVCSAVAAPTCEATSGGIAYPGKQRARARVTMLRAARPAVSCISPRKPATKRTMHPTSPLKRSTRCFLAANSKLLRVQQDAYGFGVDPPTSQAQAAMSSHTPGFKRRRHAIVP